MGGTVRASWFVSLNASSNVLSDNCSFQSFLVCFISGAKPFTITSPLLVLWFCFFNLSKCFNSFHHVLWPRTGQCRPVCPGRGYKANLAPPNPKIQYCRKTNLKLLKATSEQNSSNLALAMEKISAIFSNQRELNPSNVTVDEARTKPKKYSGIISHVPLPNPILTRA